MPVILRKAKTATSVPVTGAAQSFESLINMSNAEFSAMAAEGRKALKDQIDRHTTAAMLGITIRTLLRWHHQNFGPKRFVLSPGRYEYRRAEMEAWIAENHDQITHRRPRNLGSRAEAQQYW
jgi:predicted DNA-binding transcriptional regulator AlpA